MKSLKVKSAVLFLICGLAMSASGQIYGSDKEAGKVFKAGLKNQELTHFKIARATWSTLFKQFNFKNPKYHLMDTTSAKAINSTEWKFFLASIDTAKIQDFKLDSKVLKLSKSSNDPDQMVRVSFSSPVFSNDKNLCVFFLRQYSSPENSSGNVFFLKKNGKKWKVVKNIMTYIS